jgi:hypothetical protein
MAINCTECGEPVAPSAEFCPACLATIVPASVAQEAAATPAPPQKSATPLIIGAFVGGLLLAGAAWQFSRDKEPGAPQPTIVREPAPQAPVSPQAIIPPQPAPVDAPTIPSAVVQDATSAETSDSFDWRPANLDTSGDNWVALRSEPDLRGSRLDKLGPNVRFRVLAKRGGWWKVELSDGRTGWVSAKYVGRAQ